MAALTHKTLFASMREGRELTRPVIKNPSVVTASGIWVDLTCFGRYPAAFYYTDGTALSAQAMRRSTHGGMDHGEDKGTAYKKYLKGFGSLSATVAANPLTIWLMDYLIYYPLIPMEDVQEFDNTVTLPRYSDGRGVKMMLVEQFPYVGAVTCRVTYTNELGVAGRLSAIVTINTQTALGTLATSAPNTAGCAGPFIPLQAGDVGVRSVESIEFFTADAGNLALVLVYPYALAGHYENTAPGLWDFFEDESILPRIYDDAYVSAIALPVGSLSGAIIDCTIQTIWAAA